MARKVKDNRLDSREARSKLKPRRSLYCREIEPGLAVGYRRIKSKSGTLWARFHAGGKKYEYQSLGTADDLSDADGVAILSWWQAVDAARKLLVERARVDAGEPTGPFTVTDAIDLHCAALKRAGRPDAARDIRQKFGARIEARFGNKEAGRITTKQFETWLDELVKSPPRLRTKPGKPQRYRDLDTSDEGLRRRQASAVRLWTTLKAALNAAFRAGRIASDAAWRKVKVFESVDGVRLDYLSLNEAGRVANAAAPDFRPMVKAGLLTGARWGSLTELTVGDFNPDAGTVAFKTRKGRGRVKIYHCVLSPEGVTFFKAACATRSGASTRIFTRADGSLWKTSHQIRPMKEAIERARIGRVITFHHLRHTWASLAVMNGTPLMVVAQNLGHSDTRMVEKHYGHLAPGYRKQEILKGAPVFGIETDIAVLKRRSA